MRPGTGIRGLALVLALACIGGGVAVARSLPGRVYMRTFDQTRLFYRPAGFRMSGDSTQVLTAPCIGEPTLK